MKKAGIDKSDLDNSVVINGDGNKVTIEQAEGENTASTRIDPETLEAVAERVAELLSDHPKRPSDLTLLRLAKGFQYMLPKRHREEFAGDIHEIHTSMKEAGCWGVTIWLYLSMNIASVAWAGLNFKWDEYFGVSEGPDGQVEIAEQNNNI